MRAGSGGIHRLGDTQIDLEKINEAITTIAYLLLIQQQVGDHQGEGWTLGLLGIGQLQKGDVPKGLATMQQSITILQEPVMPDH